MAFSLPAFGRAANDFRSAYAKTGLFGWLATHAALGALLDKIHFKARNIDAAALADMIALAKSRVPVDTGRLLNGIAGEDHGSFYEFRASAVHETGNKADYARFVEFGTKAGPRGVTSAIVADEGFYSGDSFSPSPLRGRRVVRDRKSYRAHPGTPARPYFFNSASEALRERALKMQDVAAQAAAESGFPAQ